MRVEYGNGGKVHYTRDDFRRVTGIHYDDATTPRFTYDYGANGQVAYVRDNELNRTVWTEYDTSERPTRTHILESASSSSIGTPKYVNTVRYDAYGNVDSYKETVNNSASFETTYIHDVENRPMQLRYGADNRIIAYTYDAIGRVATRAANSMQTLYLTTYQYLAPENGDSIQTTPLVQSITQNGQNFSYTYDNVGNITSVTRNGLTTTYEYDSLGQLTRVNDPHAGKSTMYLYDCGGNMTGYLSAPYTLAPTLEGVNETVFYTYGDSNWKDKVTAIGGKAITYDAIGNPLTYDGWTFTWKAGRMLASMVKSGTNAQFTYDHNDLRIKKVVNGVTTNYTLNGKNVVHMTQGSHDLHFFYDAQGKPGMVTYNDVDYFYVYNLQGDVVALIDANGTQVVEYVYDAWGYPISKTGSLAATIGTLNPFRYRGYVYDEETGLYYLRSRYYNPVWKRFVNSDQHLGIVRGINTHNTYSYCFNSPCTMSDQSGQFALTAGLAATQSVVPEIGAFLIKLFMGLGATAAFIDTFAGTTSSIAREEKHRAVAVPDSMTLSKTRVLEDVEANEDKDGTYFKAYIDRGTGLLMLVGNGMDYQEAYTYLQINAGVKTLNDMYGRFIGVYTQKQSDARVLAMSLGATEAPEVHGINYFGHYHDANHQYHIWYGDPIP